MRRLILCNLTVLMVTTIALGEPLIRIGDEWRYLLTHAAPSTPPSRWRQTDYDDSQWQLATSGFYGGFGVVPETTFLPGLGSEYHAAIFRKRFHLDDPNDITWPILRIDYQNGFAAYLNGHPLVQRHLNADFNTEIPLDHLATPRFSGIATEIDLSPFRHLLVPGENVLAVQVHAQTPFDSSLVFSLELLADFTRGPFLQKLSHDSVTIVWRTHFPTLGQVDYGETKALGASIQSTKPSLEHAVQLSGLAPNTTYSYRISSERHGQSAVSKLHSFRTPRLTGPVRFAVLADSGRGSLAQYQIADQIKRWVPDLVLHGGDVVYPDFTAGRADFRCFSVYGSDMAQHPYYFSAGNHDVNHGLQPFLEAFHHPTNSTPQALHDLEGTAPELYYSFDHGDAHFTVLYVPFFTQYTLTENNPQYQWLENDLQQSTKPWKILLLHHNVFSSSAHTYDDWNRNGLIDQEELQALLVPLADQYGVQFVFSGHDHVFERFTPTSGIHFVTSAGGGGGLYNLARRLPGSAQFWRRYHFVGATIEGPQLTLEAVNTQGEVFDRMYYRQASPTQSQHSAPWHSPRIEPAPGSPLTDHNIPGQTFDLIGPGQVSVTGRESSLGRFIMNHDQDFLYLGLESSMFRTNQIAYLFIETHSDPSTASLPNESLPPLEDSSSFGALRFTESLTFEGFHPDVVCLLGDEHADDSNPEFRRPLTATPQGQGIYSFSTPPRPISGARIQQFDHSPLTHNKPNERNANLIEIAIPKGAKSSSENSQPLSMKIAGVVGILDESIMPPIIRFDTGYLGHTFRETPEGKEITPLTFQLEPNPDTDFDGLPDIQEAIHGSNPNLSDTDGDQLPDGWEVANNLSPIDAKGLHGPLGDPDQDGSTNTHEYQAGTDPNDRNSQLKLHAQYRGQGLIRIWWQATESIHYTLEASLESQGPYAIIRQGLPIGNPTIIEHYEITPPPTTRYYRLKAHRTPIPIP